MVFADEYTLNKTHSNQAEPGQTQPWQHRRLRIAISDAMTPRMSGFLRQSQKQYIPRRELRHASQLENCVLRGPGMLRILADMLIQR